VTGLALATVAVDHPFIAQIMTMVATIQVARQGGSSVLDGRFVTDRLAGELSGGMYPLPPGPFVFTTFHAAPWPPPSGADIMVWFLGQAGTTEISEWWTFVASGRHGEPAPSSGWRVDNITDLPPGLAA
jgi:hypothetical protein